MSKFTLVFIISLLSFSGLQAKRKWEPIKGKPYHFSVQITNPLSAMSKAGGVLEYRQNLSSINIALTDYIGAYQGLQYRAEYQKYIKTMYRNEYFWYIRALGGSALYVSQQLQTFGDKSNVKVGPVDYYGAGFGVGRRWNFKHFMISLNAGLKFTMLPNDMSDENKDLFRVFYATGPGSVLDLNFRFGYQF